MNSNPAKPKPPPITKREGFKITVQAEITMPKTRPTSLKASNASGSPFPAAASTSVGLISDSIERIVLIEQSASIRLVTRIKPGPEAASSAHPRPPQTHGGPSGSIDKCPISAAYQSPPVMRCPFVIIPAPNPEPTPM